MAVTSGSSSSSGVRANTRLLPRLRMLLASAVAASVFPTALAYDSIVAFGDSLTQTSSEYFMQALNTTEVFPPSPYFPGAFSNGPPYISHTAAILDLPLLDYAIGGATTGAVPGVLGTDLGFPEPLVIPSLVEQVMSHAEGSDEPVNPNALYLLYAGANDYLNAIAAPEPQLGRELVETVLGNISTAVYILVDGGATRPSSLPAPQLSGTYGLKICDISFVLPNLPPLQSIPATSRATLGARAQLAQAVLTQLVAAHNAGMIVLAADLTALGHKVAILDTDEIFQSFLLNGPSAFNITDTTQPCVNTTARTVCSNPENRLFWDSVHPTAEVHLIVGELLANEIAI